MGGCTVRYIDLFAGIGGFRTAFDKAGFKCVFSSEINEACQKVYEKNYEEIPAGDITKIDIDSIPDFEVLCGGFPCQPFSICGKKKGFEDTRGTLFFEIYKIIEKKQPLAVVLENVKHLVDHDNGNTFRVIIQSLYNLGYEVEYRILNSSQYGVAQSRERIIIVATKHGKFNFDNMQKSEPVFIKDILDKTGNFEILDKSEYTLLDSTLVKKQPSGLIFCGYRNKNIWKKGIRPNTEYLSRCHRQPNRIYSSHGIHPTLPSQETSGRFWIYIPEQDIVRKLTINECYKLMGFPETFIRDENLGNAYKQCGNSVVVPMIYELAKSIMWQGFDNGGEYGNFGRNIYELPLEWAV